MQTPHSNEVHIDVPIFRLPTWTKKTSFMSPAAINRYTQITTVEQGQIIVIILEGKELEIHSHYWSSQLLNFVEQTLWRPLPWLDSNSSLWLEVPFPLSSVVPRPCTLETLLCPTSEVIPPWQLPSFFCLFSMCKFGFVIVLIVQLLQNCSRLLIYVLFSQFYESVTTPKSPSLT